MTNEQLVILIKDKINVSDNMLKLWQQNRGFIMKMANRYKGYEDIEDLEQQGFIGLCNAVESYRPEEGVPFINYAAFWIKQSMTSYIGTCSSIVKISIQTRQNHRKYKKLMREFEMLVGRKPTDREICCYMGISHKELVDIRNSSRMEQIGSLDSYVGEDEDTTVGDLVPGHDDVESSVLDEIEMEELKHILWSMVDALPKEWKVVIRSRYQECRTLKETGKKIGATLEYVRKIQDKALKELGKPRNRHVLASYLPETVASIAYRHNGVVEFERTWTSSTELAAFRL